YLARADRGEVRQGPSRHRRARSGPLGAVEQAWAGQAQRAPARSALAGGRRRRDADADRRAIGDAGATGRRPGDQAGGLCRGLVAGGQASARDRGEPEKAQWTGRTQAGPASFPFTMTWQPRELYFAALRNGEADNFFGPVVSSWPTEQPFMLSNLDPRPPGAAQLDVTLQGVTDGPPAVDVQVNGMSVGTVTFDGQAQSRASLSVSSSQLHA